MMQRFLWAVTGVLVVAGVLSAAIVGADGGGDHVAASSSAPSAPTTTTQPGDTGAPGAVDAGGAATMPPAPQSAGSTPPADKSPLTSAAPGSTTPQAQPKNPSQPEQPQSDFRDLGAVDDAGATQVPAAGRYAYRFSDDSGESRDSSTAVEDKGAITTGARRMVLTYSGEGLDLINDALWGPDDVRFTKTTFVFGGSRFECDWQPDYVVMPLKLARGTAWEAKSTCTIQAGATSAVVSRTTRSKVTDARRVHVAGGEVLTWLIESNDHLEFPGQGSLDTKETTWFAPKLGLPVRQVGETKGDDPEDDGTKSEMLITRLTPA